jgi:hypothetical protein
MCLPLGTQHDDLDGLHRSDGVPENGTALRGERDAVIWEPRGNALLILLGGSSKQRQSHAIAAARSAGPSTGAEDGERKGEPWH